MYRRIKPGPLEKDNYVIYKALREIQNAIAKHPNKLIQLDKDHDAYKLSFNDRYVVLEIVILDIVQKIFAKIRKEVK